MSKKHYDNKNDLLKKIREVNKTQARADKAMASSWSSFMMLGLLTLYEDLNFRDKRLNMFIDGVVKRNKDFEDGNTSIEEIQEALYNKAGIVVEMPK